MRKQTWRYHSELFVATWIRLSKKWKWKCIDSHQPNSWSPIVSECSPFPLSVSLICFLSGHQTFFQQTQTWPYVTLTGLRWGRMRPHPPLALEYSRGRTYWPLLGHVHPLNRLLWSGCEILWLPQLGSSPHPCGQYYPNKQTKQE